MNPRVRRLKADHEQMISLFYQHPYINVVATEGAPAERYTIEFRLPGLVALSETTFSEGGPHRAEIFLPLDYPRRPPFCRMITPIFHPNISPQKICIGDHWSAGQRLVQLVAQIGEMITYQSYNTKSPLNGYAAAWAEANQERLPLTQVDLTAGL